MGDWIWDKDLQKFSKRLFFFFFFPLWCYQHLIPPVFHKVTVVRIWRLTQDSGVNCDDGPHPFVVTLPLIRRLFQSAGCCVTHVRATWQWRSSRSLDCVITVGGHETVQLPLSPVRAVHTKHNCLDVWAWKAPAIGIGDETASVERKKEWFFLPVFFTLS